MKIDFLQHFYDYNHTRESLIRDTDSLFSAGLASTVRAFPCFISDRFYKKIIYNDCPGIRIIRRNEEVALIEHSSVRTTAEKQHQIKGRTFIIKSIDCNNVYVIMTLDTPVYFSGMLLPFIARNYPESSLTFITHKKLYNLLRDFRDKSQLEDITIARASLKSRVDNKAISLVTWPSLSLDRAFQWVYEENGWFERITFRAKRAYEFAELEVSLSRKGIVKCNGKFTAVYEAFLRPFENTIRNNIKLFSNRSRLDNEAGDVRPLYINLGTDLFVEPEENQRFVDSLRKMKAANISVIHGNPYLNLTLVDYYDGSIHDIWVLDTSVITIIPQLKSSYQSLKRLINHIFDTFAEGRIENDGSA